MLTLRTKVSFIIRQGALSFDSYMKRRGWRATRGRGIARLLEGFAGAEGTKRGDDGVIKTRSSEEKEEPQS